MKRAFRAILRAALMTAFTLAVVPAASSGSEFVVDPPAPPPAPPGALVALDPTTPATAPTASPPRAGRASRATPATAPATRPSAAQLLSDVASPDPAVRDAARATLMLLTRDELPLLRAEVERDRPLTRQQAAALRDVVLQVYITGEHNFTPARPERRGGEGAIPRLGVLFATASTGVEGGGVIVLSRTPGYDAYRVLRDGDVIVAVLKPRIAGQPQVEWQDVASAEDVRGILRNYFRIGEFVTVRAVREGSVAELDVRLAPPIDPDPTREEPLSEERVRRAGRYWKEQFEPLLSSGSGLPLPDALALRPDDDSGPGAPGTPETRTP